MTATGERQNHTEILSGISGEGIESLQGILRMEQNTAPLKDRFTVKEEITLPSAKPEIADVLWQTIDLIEQDIRAMDGKKGDGAWQSAHLYAVLRYRGQSRQLLRKKSLLAAIWKGKASSRKPN